MPMPDAEYAALARRLEELRNATDPALSKERAEVQKKISEILVSRRKTDRFQCHLKVELKSGDKVGQGTMTNIGAGGAYVKTSLELARQADVTVTVTVLGRLPNGSVLPSSVRWVKQGDGVGLAFKELAPPVAESLKRALGELVREQPPQLPDV